MVQTGLPAQTESRMEKGGVKPEGKKKTSHTGRTQADQDWNHSGKPRAASAWRRTCKWPAKKKKNL